MPNTYGYIRVSTREQNEDRQRIALAEISVPPENIYILLSPTLTAHIFSLSVSKAQSVVPIPESSRIVLEKE